MSERHSFTAGLTSITRPVLTVSEDPKRIEPDSDLRSGSNIETVIGHVAGSVPHWSGDQMSAAENHVPLDIGTVLRERFELLSVIGAGSTGVVYRALDYLHREMEDRHPYVAIKVLGEKFKNHRSALVTLQQEVRKTQLLAHENIVGVHSFDRDGPVVYMTMELLEGKSLRMLIAENRAGVAHADAIPMIRSMARALAYAHENEIVHSDFKPGNVFLTAQNRIKVLDFGIARTTFAEVPGDSSSPSSEMSGMTPAYASLEMLRGEDPTPSDDVFALAIVALELLTGEHPFDHTPADEAKLRNVDRKLRPGLSWSQKKALSRALSADRGARHDDASEFLREFDGSGAIRTATQIGITAAAAIAVIAVAAMRGGDPGPAIDFDDLPMETQQRFDAAMTEGETALGFGDSGINEALYYFSEAYTLHPDNPRAVLGLESVANRFLSSIRTTDIQTQRDVFDLLYCQNYLRSYSPVVSACTELLGAECDSISASCTMRTAE